jgi:hypothetical protein
MPRVAAFLAAALFLSACSDQDWNHALTYAGLGGSRENAAIQPAAAAAPPPTSVAQSAPAPVQAAPAPVPEGAQPQPNAFCGAVASQDATGNDFDPPTQQRVFVQSYRQCVAVFGDAVK